MTLRSDSAKWLDFSGAVGGGWRGNGERVEIGDWAAEGRKTERLAGFTARAASAPDGFRRASETKERLARKGESDGIAVRIRALFSPITPEASTVTQEGGKKGNGT